MHAPDEQLVGTVLGGRYRVTCLLAAGGMGAVYQAEQLGLGRKVAVKVMHPLLADDGDALDRFEREARVVASIGHPNVVQVYDFHRGAGELAWLAMELVAGRSLAQVLRDEGALPPARVVSILLPLLSALEAAHAVGVFHRDLKPGNLMVTALPGQAESSKLLDFGIAKLAEGRGATQLTRTGAVLGTPQYMAPEQALGKAIDGRTDLYSVGVIAWTMLAGRPPFPRGAVADVLEAVVATIPPPPSQLRADVPPALDALVTRAMAKRPADRFQSAREMSDALRTALATTTTISPDTRIAPAARTDLRPVPAPALEPPVSRRPETVTHRGPLIMLAVAIAAVLAVLLAGYASLWVARAYMMARAAAVRPPIVLAPPTSAPWQGTRSPAPAPRPVVGPIAATPPTLTRATMRTIVADALPRANAVVPGAMLSRVMGECLDANGHIAAHVDDSCGWTVELVAPDGRARVAVSYEIGTPEPFVATGRAMGEPSVIAAPDSLPDSDVAMRAARAITQCAAFPVGNVHSGIVYRNDPDVFMEQGQYASHGDVVSVYFGRDSDRHEWEAEVRGSGFGPPFQVCY